MIKPETKRNHMCKKLKAWRRDPDGPDYAFWPAIVACVLFIIILFLARAPKAHADEPVGDQNYILAIIGEAEAEGLDGMRAVASAIRNRARIMKDPLKGVYGATSKRVKGKLYSKKTYNQAVQAWADSKEKDYSYGATGWGNENDVKQFERTKWWKNCRIVYRLKGHYFYKENRIRG
jgi:hypothetical protein